MGPKAGEGWKVLGGKLDMTNPLTRPFFARCPGFMEYMAFNGPAQQVLGGYPLGTPERPGEGVVRERVSGGYLERYLLKKKIFHEATLEPSNLSSHKIPTSLV